MRLTGLFSARESMISEGQAIAQISDNISNSNTTGYKATRTEFSDVFASGQGELYGEPLPVGNGVAVADERTLVDKQGAIDFTDRSLDVAVDGRGFFTLTDGTSTFYSRNGVFNVDPSGNLINEDGDKVMGFTAASPTTPVALVAGATSLAASPTTTITVTGNANASAATLAALPAAGSTFANLNAAADFTTPITVIDSLGQSHDIGLYFFKTNTNTYTVQAYVDAGETGGTAGTPAQVGTATVAFGANGTQAAGAATNLAVNAAWNNGASAQAATVDLTGLTQFSAPSALNSVTSNGSKAGSVTGYEVLDDGTVNATFDTGGKTTLGTLALTTFTNPYGLDRVGSNKFSATSQSGTGTVDKPGLKGRGATRGGALENSTVDPANEFVDLIRYQRAYQAGSQIIQTYSQLLDRTIQIG